MSRGGPILEGALNASGRLQVVAPRKNRPTAEQIETFFATLADTCNVQRSARTAGFGVQWAYRRRKVDAVFRQNWAAALSEGYGKLEWVLLERAIKGTPKLVRTAGGSDRVMREYSTALGVALLRRHADTVDSFEQGSGDDDVVEVRARILEKLERIRERGVGQDVQPEGEISGWPPVEIKSADCVSVAVRLLRAGWR